MKCTNFSIEEKQICFFLCYLENFGPFFRVFPAYSFDSNVLYAAPPLLIDDIWMRNELYPFSACYVWIVFNSTRQINS